MARKPVTIGDLLGHPLTHNAVQQLASGVDPRLVAAQLAGLTLQQQIAARLGVAVPRDVSPKAAASGDVIDADYTVVNVSPGVKKKQKVG